MLSVSIFPLCSWSSNCWLKSKVILGWGTSHCTPRGRNNLRSLAKTSRDSGTLRFSLFTWTFLDLFDLCPVDNILYTTMNCLPLPLGLPVSVPLLGVLVSLCTVLHMVPTAGEKKLWKTEQRRKNQLLSFLLLCSVLLFPFLHEWCGWLSNTPFLISHASMIHYCAVLCVYNVCFFVCVTRQRRCKRPQ